MFRNGFIYRKVNFYFIKNENIEKLNYIYLRLNSIVFLELFFRFNFRNIGLGFN